MSVSPSARDPEFIWIDIDQIEPNPWNPNAMDDEMFSKAIESIHRFGFVDPVTVRQLGDRYQIIDGEHRWLGAQSHSDSCREDLHVGYLRLPAIDLGVIPDPVAQQLTIVLNETRGESDPKKLGSLLTTLLISEPLPQLAEILPFTAERISELAELPKVDWGLTGNAPKRTRDDRWVERVYRMPVEAAKTLDEAITASRVGAEADWEALKRIAEAFISDG